MADLLPAANTCSVKGRDPPWFAITGSGELGPPGRGLVSAGLGFGRQRAPVSTLRAMDADVMVGQIQVE